MDGKYLTVDLPTSPSASDAELSTIEEEKREQQVSAEMLDTSSDIGAVATHEVESDSDSESESDASEGPREAQQTPVQVDNNFEVEPVPDMSKYFGVGTASDTPSKNPSGGAVDSNVDAKSDATTRNAEPTAEMSPVHVQPEETQEQQEAAAAPAAPAAVPDTNRLLVPGPIDVDGEGELALSPVLPQQPRSPEYIAAVASVQAALNRSQEQVDPRWAVDVEGAPSFSTSFVSDGMPDDVRERSLVNMSFGAEADAFSQISEVAEAVDDADGATNVRADQLQCHVNPHAMPCKQHRKRVHGVNHLSFLLMLPRAGVVV